MAKVRATETVTIRMPPGTVGELKAATGQKFSTLARAVLLALLAAKKAELLATQRQSAVTEAEISTEVNKALS